MNRYASERSARFYAQTYDVSVSDWPGEMDFYRGIVEEEMKSKRGAVLEIVRAVKKKQRKVR